MNILTKITLLCIFSVLVVAKSDFSHFTPSYIFKEYKVAYNSQYSKIKLLPAVGISLKSKLSDYKFTFAYASEVFKNIKLSNINKDMKNIYFHVQYKF